MGNYNDWWDNGTMIMGKWLQSIEMYPQRLGKIN